MKYEELILNQISNSNHDGSEAFDKFLLDLNLEYSRLIKEGIAIKNKKICTELKRIISLLKYENYFVVTTDYYLCDDKFESVLVKVLLENTLNREDIWEIFITRCKISNLEYLEDFVFQFK